MLLIIYKHTNHDICIAVTTLLLNQSWMKAASLLFKADKIISYMKIYILKICLSKQTSIYQINRWNYGFN